MTSRAEYRLFLRQDNADLRLTPIGRRIGLISDERYKLFEEKKESIEKEKERLRSTYIAPTELLREILEGVGSNLPPSGISLAELLKRPQVTYEVIAPVDKDRVPLTRDITFAVETDLKYEGYLKLELEKIEKFSDMERKKLPENIDYEDIKGLRLEARQKLSKHRPENLGQASRISGVSPADISVLHVYLEMLKRGKNG